MRKEGRCELKEKMIFKKEKLEKKEDTNKNKKKIF